MSVTLLQLFSLETCQLELLENVITPFCTTEYSLGLGGWTLKLLGRAAIQNDILTA